MSEGHNPLDLVGQERAAATEAAEEQRQLGLRQNDLRFVMSSKEGRRFIWRTLGEAGLFKSSFSTDAGVMAFNEGSRSRGTELLAQILEACPKRYLEAQSENMTAKEQDARRSDTPR